jgi:hypothetical protein
MAAAEAASAASPASSRLLQQWQQQPRQLLLQLLGLRWAAKNALAANSTRKRQQALPLPWITRCQQKRSSSLNSFLAMLP